MQAHVLFLSAAATFRRWACVSSTAGARRYNLDKARQHVANARALRVEEAQFDQEEQDEYWRSEGFAYNPETW